MRLIFKYHKRNFSTIVNMHFSLEFCLILFLFIFVVFLSAETPSKTDTEADYRGITDVFHLDSAVVRLTIHAEKNLLSPVSVFCFD